MTVLVCEHNNHVWHREPQRGRPPKYCDEHKHLYENKDIKVTVRKEDKPKSLYDLVPGLEEALAEENTRELFCEIGQHTWQAPRQRGRIPRNCPAHTPQGITRAISPAKPSQRVGEQLRAILAAPAANICQCDITEETSAQELRHMKNCCDPQFICSTLDKCRRAVGI